MRPVIVVPDDRPKDQRPYSLLVLDVIALLWGVTLAINAPGHLSSDSVVQLNEGRTETYLSMHPPLMSALLGLADRVIPGTALYLALSSLLFFVALALLSGRSRHPALTTAVVIAVWLTPLVLVYQGIIWKDVLFANLAVLAFAVLTVGDVHERTKRYVAYGVAACLAGLAALVRQNGFFVPLCVGLAAGFFEDRWTPRPWLGNRIAQFFCVMLFAVVLAGASAAFSSGLVSVTAARQVSAMDAGLATLARYDIAGIVARAESADLRLLADRGVDVDRFRKAVFQTYTPERLDYLGHSEVFAEAFSRLSPGDILRLWRTLAISQPGSYLAHRAAVFRWLLLPPNPDRCLPIHIGVAGPEDLMRELKLQPGVRPSDQALYTYSRRFIGGPLMSPTFHCVVAILLLALLLLRPAQGRAAVVLMLVSALSFVASFLVIGIACDFRYTYFLPIAVIATLAYVSAQAPRLLLRLPGRTHSSRSINARDEQKSIPAP
jgi:hypothetical protein